jgi:hypothetical protein
MLAISTLLLRLGPDNGREWDGMAGWRFGVFI